MVAKMKKHVWLDLWHGTDGWVFYSTFYKPVLDHWLYKTKCAFEGKNWVVHVWSHEEFSYNECRKILHSAASGHTMTLLKDGQWIE